jgi:hypothetical protein
MRPRQAKHELSAMPEKPAGTDLVELTSAMDAAEGVDETAATRLAEERG